MEPQQELEENHDESLHDNNYSEMSEAEREAEFKKQHEEYIALKMARKKEIEKLRKAEFGSSSSDESEDDIPASQSSSSEDGENEEQVQNNGVDQNHTSNTKAILTNGRESEKISVWSQNKKGGEWAKDIVEMNPNSLIVSGNVIEAKSISKIKLISELIQNCQFRIKINYEDSEIIFAPIGVYEQEENHLPINYCIFAKIIEAKLSSMGIKLGENRQEKIPGVPETIINNSLIFGKINKKSQVLGKWEERFIVINKEGIFSYKKFNEKYTMHIGTGAIKEIWTRFEIIEEMIVFKVMHNGKKTEFGLPVCETLSQNSWVYHFYNLMGKK